MSMWGSQDFVMLIIRKQVAATQFTSKSALSRHSQRRELYTDSEVEDD
jgi:hypothetical protein